MLEGYKVLRALLETTGPFTVADIAAATGVKAVTVRTVLGRESQMVRALGRAEPTGRGGRAIRYELDPAQQTHLATRLREFELIASPPLIAVDPGTIPTALLAAEDILFALDARPDDPETRTANVALARMGLEQGRRALRDAQDPGSSATLAQHVKAVELLLALEEVEGLQRDGSTPGYERIEELRTAAKSLAAPDARLWHRVVQRLIASPVGPMLGPEFGRPVIEVVDLASQADVISLVERKLGRDRNRVRIRRLDRLPAGEPVSPGAFGSAVLLLGPERQGDSDVLRRFAARRQSPDQLMVVLDAAGLSEVSLLAEAAEEAVLYLKVGGYSKDELVDKLTHLVRSLARSAPDEYPSDGYSEPAATKISA